MKYRRILVTGGSGFIGTNLLEYLGKFPGVAVINVDLVAPKIEAHRRFWIPCDIRLESDLLARVKEFYPDAVIHLAARTDLDGKTLPDYSSNTVGTEVLLHVLDAINFRGPAIFTSSMYVCRPGYRPTSDTDYQPHTIYGESKVAGELIVRKANPTYPWVITRPTSIWGPWFGVPYINFFQMVLSRRYMHIAGDTTRKTYGYVGNTVAQLVEVLSGVEKVNGKVLYIGDWPEYSIREWADEISAFDSYKISIVPIALFRVLAILGDALQWVGVGFPMTSFRLNNLTTNNVHDLEPIRSLVDGLPYTRAEGNRITIDWLRKYG